MLTFKNMRYINASSYHANIAQLVELLICNQWVGSSSLSVGTNTKTPLNEVFFVCQRELERPKNRQQSIILPA